METVYEGENVLLVQGLNRYLDKVLEIYDDSRSKWFPYMKSDFKEMTSFVCNIGQYLYVINSSKPPNFALQRVDLETQATKPLIYKLPETTRVMPVVGKYIFIMTDKVTLRINASNGMYFDCGAHFKHYYGANLGGSALVACSSKIYGISNVFTSEVFSLQTNMVSRLRSLPKILTESPPLQPRSRPKILPDSFQATSFNNKIYVVELNAEKGKMSCYDPQFDEFEEMNPIYLTPFKHSGEITVHDQKLVSFDNTDLTIRCYNFANNSWRLMAKNLSDEMVSIEKIFSVNKKYLKRYM